MLHSTPPTTTSKLQYNYRKTIIENCLKSRQKEVLSLRIYIRGTVRLVGGAEAQNVLVPHPCAWVKNWEGYFSAAEIPPEEQGVPFSLQAPQPRYPVLGREVPITSGCENKQTAAL